MYRLHGKAVLNYLPRDDTSTRRNVLYKNLFDSFTQLDGNTINTQVKLVWEEMLALSFMIETLGMFACWLRECQFKESITSLLQKPKKGAEKEDGEKEKEEIRSLQEQLAVLKEISVG